MRRVVLIPGDGIGPSVTEAARHVIDASGAKIEWIVAEAGEAALRNGGDPLPARTVDEITRTRLALKGPVTTPVGGGFESVNVALRKRFDLFANLRPARGFPGVKCLFPDLDLVIIRENTEGLYTSMEHWIGRERDAAVGIGVNTRHGMERIVRFAFDFAVREGRSKVTVVHKANVLKLLSGLILEVARKIAPEYPSIRFEDRIVDNTAMQLVMKPQQFDVIVTTNLFGDILSDLAAGLVGGLGMAPGANFGTDAAIFEAVHGSAPDIAGKDIANPTSVILAGIMMLRHIGMNEEADRADAALKAVIREGREVTPDLDPRGGGGTTAMTEAVVREIERGAAPVVRGSDVVRR